MTPSAPTPPAAPPLAPSRSGRPIDADSLCRRYLDIRVATMRLCDPLEVEDFIVQSMPDASPAKWHLAHTSWFFESFVLRRLDPRYTGPHPQYDFLFNSYYNLVGPMHERPKRGLLSRPTVAETRAYREHVDDSIVRLLRALDGDTLRDIAPVIELGLNHEQQHQELLLTDIKHMLSCNPLRPAYEQRDIAPCQPAPPLDWIDIEEGVREIGHEGDAFAYDNESPRHRAFIQPIRFASRLITCGEYLEFIRENAYHRPELWLSDAWAILRNEQWQAPLYWFRHDDVWGQFTLRGVRDIDPNETLAHVSYYEADAYARWRGYRLPSEQEWEAVAASVPVDGNLADTRRLHPAGPPAQTADRPITQLYGDVWEWTASAYAPYPGFRAPEGAVGEYNAKFMCNQMVLRGGSCATPRDHIRHTYRNFFPPHARWQFSGIRLVRDA